FRTEHALAYDHVNRGVLLFGGTDHTGNVADTWLFDGAQWVHLEPATNPSPRYGHALASDAKRERIVLFGGDSSSGERNDTWEWDGTKWINVTPDPEVSPSPPPRFDHALAYDSDRNVVVLFGGRTRDGQPFNDTWEW